MLKKRKEITRYVQENHIHATPGSHSHDYHDDSHTCFGFDQKGIQVKDNYHAFPQGNRENQPWCQAPAFRHYQSG